MYPASKNLWLAASLAVMTIGTTPALASTTSDAGDPVSIMASCGAVKNPDLGGAKASWTVRCNSTQIWIEGWVKDTRSDGMCGWVTANYPDGSTWTSNKACPEGNKDTFSSPPRDGRIIDAYLQKG